METLVADGLRANVFSYAFWTSLENAPSKKVLAAMHEHSNKAVYIENSRSCQRP